VGSESERRAGILSREDVVPSWPLHRGEELSEGAQAVVPSEE